MKIPIELFGAVVLDLGLAIWVNRKQHKLILDLHESRDTLMGELSYMCHILNENGIKLDEFDMIALPHVTRVIDEIQEGS
jgi:hypothetical protein